MATASRAVAHRSRSLLASLVACAIAALSVATSAIAAPSPTAALDPEREWLVGRIAIEGNDAIPRGDLRRVIETRPRRRFAFWRARPGFDRTVFERDLERILRLY